MTCLTCPDEANLGDVALQLQKTALEAEACIFEREQLLRSAVNRPTILVTTTASFAVPTGVETTLAGSGTPVVTFNNSTITTPANAWQNFFLIGGIIACGITYNATAGVPTDNTLRRTALGLRNIYDPSPDFSQSLVFTQYETTATGGVDVAVHGVFAALPGATLGNATLYHLNGSNITIAAGAILWATRLGDDTATRTA